MQDEIKIIATQGAVDSLDKLQQKIQKLDSAFLALVDNFEKGVQPSKLSEFKTAIENEKLLSEQLKNQAKDVKTLKDRINELELAKKRITSVETQEISDKRRVNKEINSAVMANSSLAKSYEILSYKRTQAKNKLQDLIASEKASNSEIRQAQKEFDILNKKVAQADKAVGRFSDANRKINGLSQSVGNLMAAFGVATGLNLAVDLVRDIYSTTKALQSMDLALKMVSETEMEYAKNKVFVTEVSERWGLEVKTLQQTYTQFYTASKGLLSDNAIKETFEGIAKAGSVMGLSLEQQQAAFYAIDQIMSKGTVTAEELKKQLGNAMPGAIKAAAMAYKDLHPQIKTIQEAEKGLYADMKKGAIDSATYVPLIAKNFQILYGIESLESVNTMQSAQNRLQNSWTDWVKSLSSSNSTTNKAVELINFLSKNLSTLINVVVKGGTILGVYLGVTKTLNFLTTQSILLTEAYSIAKGVLNKRMTAEVVLTQRETALRILNTAGTTAQTTATIAQTSATEVATVATNRFNLALLRNPLVAIIALITAGVTAYLLLRDSTDDATTSLIKYEQAKRKAEQEAVKEVGGISNKENRLKSRLELEGKELLRLRQIQKTATDEDLKETNDRIKAKESEIELIRERLRLEGINVKTKSKEASDKAYVSANKLQAERDSLELKKLDKQEELEKNIKFINTKEGIASYNTTKARIEFLRDELKTIQEQIRAKNVEITKQNKIFSELRPDALGKANGEVKVETEEQKQARIDKKNKDAERQARLNEQLLKDKYEAELSNLKMTEEAYEDYINNKKNFNDDEVSYWKAGTDKKIAYSLKLAKAEIEVAERVYEEKKRLALKEANERGLTKAQTSTLLVPINNDLSKSKADSLQKNANRVTNIYSDFFKKVNENAELEGIKFEKSMDKFKMTDKRVKDLEDYNKKIKDELEASFRVFNAYAGDFADKSGFKESFDFLGQVNPDTGKTMFQNLFGKDGEAEASEYFLAVTTIAQDAYNLIESLGDQKHQREMARLEQQYSVARENAQGFEEAQKRIDKEYAKRKEQLEKKEFERKKKLNMVNIVMDTAQAIMAVLGKTGQAWMIPVIAALGLTQLGIVANQKMPAYKDGTLNHKGGLALVNDGSGSNFQETIVTPDGTLIRPKDRNVVMDLPQGTQVYNHEQFQRHLNNISQEQVNHTVVNGGISFSEMDNLLGKHIASQTRVSNQFSGGELVEFVNKNGNIIKRTANRGNGIGVKFS